MDSEAMAGLPEGGSGSEGADRTLGSGDDRVPSRQWQAGSARFEHSLEVPAQCMPYSAAAQCSPSDLRASHATLPLENPATLKQEIVPTEQQIRVELERFRRGFGQSDSASSTSASAPEKKESSENTGALMITHDSSMRCDSSRGVSTLEAQEFQDTSVEPEDVPDQLSPTMVFVSAFAHLTTFGILGVCIRYGLRILFSDIARVTANDSSLFIDLPANMVGCFFMGWVGVVLKKDIAAYSELLVIGLSTGLMGSITTYASWNQELLHLVTNGLWVRSIVGLIIGLELSQMSLSVGMDSARLLRYGVMYIRRYRVRGDWQKKWGCSVPDNPRRQRISFLLFLSASFILWGACVVLTVIDADSTFRRRLWLSCVVGPPGVWARWLLARLNGQGIGRKQYLKWLPVGTLLTNVVASTLQAVLATVLLAATDDTSLLCSALQTGLLGCMSTVSTFVTELYFLHQSPKRWRAYAYFCVSFFCSYSMGALVYTLPVLVDNLSS